jgi:hypothetical protein
VAFETGSKLSRIEVAAFAHCSSLSSICIPSSVEILREWCFAGCQALCNVTFEADSRLSHIEPFAFSNCSSLSSIGIPAGRESVLHPFWNTFIDGF